MEPSLRTTDAWGLSPTPPQHCLKIQINSLWVQVGIDIFKSSPGTCTMLPSLSTTGVMWWFSDLSVHQKHLEGELKHRLLGPTPRVSSSVGLGGA